MTLNSVIQTGEAPAAVGPYSQAVVAGGLVFVSGQLGIDPQSGNLVGDDVSAQAEQSLKNLLAVIRAAGLQMTDVVRTTVFLTDMSAFAAVNEVYARFFNAPYPARACVQVAALPKNALVEIDAIAVTVE
ncbi:MAG: RidA family protein [Spartobacteria bacterium]|nr:RidA family protein [Spartobacteria bacterium]